ncbi:MAG: diguanylate cyclase [Nitrospiraceae bacterium]|nr:MAG: diguanylate cyclase [Nitrospiraceae bacterium]
MEIKLKLIRPKLSIGIKTLAALTIVFWVPVLALIIALYYTFNDRLSIEGLDTVKSTLKGALVLYDQRTNTLHTLLDQVTSQPSVKEMITRGNSRDLQELLLDLGKKNTHAEILIAVNANQKVLSRRNGRTGDIVILGDALSRSLLTGETLTSTELITQEFLKMEEESLAKRIRTIGIAQFVISPVRAGDKVAGAIIAGILLSGESWLGNSIHNQFGVEMALFAGETFESLFLHSAASLPRTTWIVGQPVPAGLKEEISLGRPYYGNLVIDGINNITAFEPVRDSRNRVIGAIGISSPAKNIAAIVAGSIGKVLVFVMSGALLIAIFITVVIYLDVTRPIKTLVHSMQRFEEGDMNTSIELKTGDEFEKLGNCFNSMAESVRRRDNRLKKHYEVAKLLMSTIDLSELTDKILNIVMDVTESQLGILYLCNDADSNLVPVAHYGCRSELPTLKQGEGLPGRALQETRCIIVNQPADRDGVIEMGFVQSVPAEIAYIPLAFNNSRIGVLVIGNINKYSPDERELFHYLGNQIAVALDNTIIHRRIQDLSITDPLTGLNNRRYLEIRLEEEWSRCNRLNEPLSIILADLDNFKSVNDTYGHDRGDEVLKNMAKIMQKHSRKEDVVVRYGGEEFVIVQANMSNYEAVKKAQAINDAVRNSKYSWAKGEITVSVGVATFPDMQVDNPVHLLHLADKAMYKAKTNGKDRVVICT